MDTTAFVADVFFARALKQSNHLLWYSDSPKPDLGGEEADDHEYGEEYLNPDYTSPVFAKIFCLRRSFHHYF